MAAIDQIINVQITAATAAVATDSFAIPLIFGPTKAADKVAVETYTDPQGLLDDGYDTDDLEYVYAVAMFSQTVRPTTFKVSKRSAAGSVADDLAAVVAADSTWYGAVFPGLSDADIEAAATAIEALPKIAVFASSTAAIGTDATDDVLSKLKAKGFSRSALIFSPGSAAKGIDAGIVGGQLPKQPGSTSWAYKPIDGVAVDTLSASQLSKVVGSPLSGSFGKNGNVYEQIAGVNVFLPGRMANGAWIDIVVGTDSLVSVIKSNIMQAIVANEKIPYTEQGCSIVDACIRAAIATHQGYNFLDSDPRTVSVTHTPVFMVSATQRASRVAPPFKFECRATGAMQSFSLQGTINI